MKLSLPNNYAPIPRPPYPTHYYLPLDGGRGRQVNSLKRKLRDRILQLYEVLIHR